MKKTNLFKNLVYNKEKPAISVLFESETTKEIRIVFKQGQVMQKHQTPFPITVEIVDGKLDFGIKDEIVQLETGDLVALEGGVPHDLKAITDCVVRLSINKQDSVQRVKDVINLK